MVAAAPEVVPEAAIAWPGYGGSAIGAEGFDGVLASSGSDQPMPIASISKVITALVVLDAHPIPAGEEGPTVTLTARDAALYSEYIRINAKVVPSPAGLTLTERQLLEVTLVSSANNYADTLATWAFGSTDAYVSATSEWLTEHGLSSTTIVEPTGMSPSNRSTTADLVPLGKLALADPLVSEIVGMRSVDLPTLGTLENSNELLGIDGVDGIKTGTLDEAGACLLFSADYSIGDEQITVIGVVLGGVDHDTLDVAVRALLASVEDGFREVTVAREGQAFASYSTPWDAEASAVAAEGASLLVWDDTPVTSRLQIDDIPPVEFGRRLEDVGTVTFTSGPRSVAVRLALDEAITPPDAWWMLSHPFEAGSR